MKKEKTQEKRMFRYVKFVVMFMLTLGAFSTLAFAYMAFTKPPFPPVYYADTNVQCLPRGHRDIAQVMRVPLSIMVDEISETLPMNIGNTTTCLTEIHTHEAGNSIHVEVYRKARMKELTYADFFAVWGQPIEREGYTLVITKGSEQVESLSILNFDPAETVTLSYTTTATSMKEVKK